MDLLQPKNYVNLNLDHSLWDQVFTVAPLVVIGTKEGEGYDLAPKHMVTPLGFGNYFGFVCTPRHGTYNNICTTKHFTVSFPKPDQLINTSLSASPRKPDISKSSGIISALPVVKAKTIEAPLLANAYLYLECELFKIVDGFDSYSLICGKVLKAYAEKDFLRVSEADEQQQLYSNPLLAYIAPGRFSKISDTQGFPFPKDFKR